MPGSNPVPDSLTKTILQGLPNVSLSEEEDWDFQIDQTICTVSFDGPMQDCLSARPLVGGILTGFSSYGMVVTSVKVKRMEGDMGRITVTLRTTGVDDVNQEPIGNPTYSLEFQELQKPLETHPNCGTLKADRPINGTGQKKTWEDWAQLTDADYQESEDSDSPWALSDYQSLKEKGVDSYAVGAPIIRRRLLYLTPPAGVGANSFTIQSPPSGSPADGIDGFEWLLGQDRIAREGEFYARETEWTGANTWDSLIYSSS